MTPPPEPRAAPDAGSSGAAGDLLDGLLAVAERIRRVVPRLTGASLSVLTGGLTFTVVATSSATARLDAVQYLHGGPCVDDPGSCRALTTDGGDAAPNGRWHVFALANAAAGVASTLTLPVMEETRRVGSVNLYAASSRAFEGRHDTVAVLVEDWAAVAVHEADRSLRDRVAAETTPHHADDLGTVNRAIGTLISSRELAPGEAHAWLRNAAQRAGVTELDLARTLVGAKGVAA